MIERIEKLAGMLLLFNAVAMLTAAIVMPQSAVAQAPDCAAAPLECRCVVAVWDRHWLIPANKLQTGKSVRWSQIARLNNQRLGRTGGKIKRLAALYIFYDDLGGQQGPLGINMLDRRLAIAFIPGVAGEEPRDSLFYHIWGVGANRAQDQGFRWGYTAPLDATESITEMFGDEETGNLSESVMNDAGTSPIRLIGTRNATVAADASAPGLVETITADIDANGC